MIDKTRTYTSRRNLDLARWALLRARQDRIFSRPQPPLLVGQLSLFDGDAGKPR